MSYDEKSSPTQTVAPPVGVKQVSWPMIRTQKDLAEIAEKFRNGSPVYALQGKKIGEILNALGAIDDKTLHAVEQHHATLKIKTKPIGQLLIQMKLIEEEVLTRGLCIQNGVPMVDLMAIHIPHDVLDRIPNKMVLEKKAVPVGVFNKTLYLAVGDPVTFGGQNDFAFTTKLKIHPVYSPAYAIDAFLSTKWAGAGADFWAG